MAARLCRHCYRGRLLCQVLTNFRGTRVEPGPVMAAVVGSLQLRRILLAVVEILTMVVMQLSPKELLV